MSSRDAIPVRTFVTCSLGASVIATLVLGFEHDLRWSIASAALFAVIVVAWLATRSAERVRVADTLLWVASFNVLLLLPELVLRATDFKYVSGIQFGYPRPEQFVQFEPDKDRFWKLRSSRSDVNAWGFHGKNVRAPTPGTCRLIFLGDSCMEHGYREREDYPRLTVEYLRQISFRKSRIDFLSLAVPGYTSHQGRRTVEAYADSFQATIAIVAYGWNDHWLAYGATDRKKRISTTAIRLYNNVRLLQLVRRLRSRFRGPDKPLDSARVPIEHYRENLTAIASTLASKGATVVFMTPPTSHYAAGVPPHLVELGLANDASSVTRLHAEYNNVVRQVAAETGALLFDLEFELEALDSDELRIFSKDGIHFTYPGGRRWIASKLAMFLFDSCNSE